MQWAAPIRIKRSELYQRLWSTPTTKVAKEIGVSDVALNKVCTKHRIPKPPLGYWARLQHGKIDKQIPLPELESGADPLIEIRPRFKGEKAPLPEELRSISINKIELPDERVRFHPMVSKTKAGFRGAHSNEYGRLSAQTTDCLNIAVSKNSLDRALRIFDALIKAMEKMGFTVRATGGGHFSVQTSAPKTETLIAEEWVEFRMEERALRSEAPPQPKTHSWSFSPKWIYTPSGKLTILIESYIGDSHQRSWSDRDSSPLEENLGAIISGLMEAAAAMKQRRMEWARQDAVRKERERLIKEAELRRQQEEAVARDIEHKATRWRQSRDLFDLALEVEQEAKARGKSIDEGSQISEWLKNARCHAAKISPIEDLLR